MNIGWGCFREIANQLYVTPQIPEECVFRDIVEQDYGDDYRRAFVEHPRVRLDGVYISVCHCKFCPLPSVAM